MRSARVARGRRSRSSTVSATIKRVTSVSVLQSETTNRHAPKQLRLLWTMQATTPCGRSRRRYEHPNGTELRVYFEPKECDDVQQSDVHAFDVICVGRSIRLDEHMFCYARDVSWGCVMGSADSRVSGARLIGFTCTITESRHGAASKCSPALHRSAPDTCYSARSRMRAFRLRGCRATVVGCM
jgi:hypothetical protein